MAVLGCAQEYRAVIHWRGGSLPFTSPGVSALTAVSWNRTLSDTSEASITIAKGSAGAECCAQLGKVEPFAHDLSIYRDSELVWQGPVFRVTENRTRFVVEARDVTEWLARTVNTTLLRYVSTNPADPKRQGPVQEIAESIIRENLLGGLFASGPDWPRMVDYIVRQDDTVTARYEKDGSLDNEIWIVPILRILDEELVPRGLEYTTVGRALVLGRPQTTADPAQARLTLDAFAGDVEIVRDGTNAASLVWVTNQEDQDISGSQYGVSGVVSAYYGRLDYLIRTTAEGLTAYDLWQIARGSYTGRNPVPTSLRIPDGAGLAATAPVSMRQLVPGVRIDVAATGMCMGLSQPYRLSDVDVDWGDNGENVGVSLIPLGDPFVGDPP
ncbi:hypothetical protein J7E96_19465 [Streptomyces sp. ISL-96]|uniref:hypothetical protein n=1 Tax=Streptomyces sp. ISL-96 TaxID=2819191 RepID=UPI001BE8C3FB|nr:hypothetical protein [Streptomyces sp. ISL-96]MBT2490654.1 hypothetical protein [Streptomyces sp. ISL-96]